MALLLRELFASLLFIALLSTHAEDEEVEDIVGSKTILKKMDTDEDGLLTEDEVHVGVRAWFAELGLDEQEFEKHFATPMLMNYFPNSDADSDGKLNLEELHAFVKMMFDHEVEEDPKTILKNMDKDEDGLITEDELHVGVRAWFAELGHDEQEFEKHFAPMLKNYFPKSDADSDGKLNLEELQACMKMMDEHEADLDPKTILKKMDKDEDGLLTEDELHVGVRAWFAELGHDEQEFEKHFAPMLKNYFPKSDADSDGKLNLEELQAFMKMMDEHEAEDNSEFAVAVPLPPFMSPSGEEPYIGACPYPSGCGPDCGIRWKDVPEADCPMTCSAGYSLSCQDNSTSGDGAPPGAVCRAVGEGYRLVGVGGERGITCCRCTLDSELASLPQSPVFPPPLPEGPDGQCEFDNEPTGAGHFWDQTCKMGDLGCDGDGKHVQCRLCGGGDFVSIPCPASSCKFPNHPFVPYYWDSECEVGELGCWADGIHVQCRFCGDFPFTGIPCPEDAEQPPQVACAFVAEPETAYYWDPTCVLGKHGCNADGKHVHCRWCGGGGFSDIHCPSSHVCQFEEAPTVPYFWDPNCGEGMLGCKADGVSQECRFCGARPFEAVPCPEPEAPSHNECSWPQRGEPLVPFFWDESCDMGQLGCWADGLHAECRFCGAGVFIEVACPNVTSTSHLRGSGAAR